MSEKVGIFYSFPGLNASGGLNVHAVIPEQSAEDVLEPLGGLRLGERRHEIASYLRGGGQLGLDRDTAYTGTNILE